MLLKDAAQLIEQKKTQGADTISDQILFAYVTINRFLCAFIDHTFGDLGYVITVRM